jgi:N,N'-diacetylchitobiose transport system permease protein
MTAVSVRSGRPPARKIPAPRKSGAVAGRHTKTIANVLGVGVLLVMLFPIYWAVSTSFKRGVDMVKVTPEWFPIPGTLLHYRDAWHKAFFLSSLRNSAIIVSFTVVVAIGAAFFAAVAVARTNFRGRRAYIILIIVIQMIPQTALIIPLFVMLSRVHQQNQLAGVAFTYLAFVLPFSVWTLRGFIANIPKDLEDAAMIDGCSRFIAFIQAWNEFTFAYVIIQDNSKETATVWLASFITQEQVDWGGLMAGATMLSIPIVILFLLVQRHFATGLTAGAVKG